MTISSMLSSMASAKDPAIEIKDYGSSTVINGGYAYTYVDWDVGDLILLVSSANASYNATANFQVYTPNYMTTLDTLYVNDSYDVNTLVYGAIATDTGTRTYSRATLQSVSGVANWAVVIKAGTWNGVLPTLANGGVVTNTGTNSGNVTWPSLTETNNKSLHLLFGQGASSTSQTYNDPGDLDFFNAIVALDTYRTAHGFGYKVVNSTWTPNSWTLPTDSAAFSNTQVAIKLHL